MTTRAKGIAQTLTTEGATESVLSKPAANITLAPRASEAPFVTTFTVEERELHRVSLAPLYLHESRPSKRCEPFYLSSPPEVTFTPEDCELHPVSLAISPITITLPGLSGVSALRPAEVDPVIGQIVADKYKVLARVGRGGTGSVYKAEHMTTGRPLALKLLTKERALLPHAVHQLRQEAKVTAKLNHPHTVKVIDFGESEQFVYLAMEYLLGLDLASVLRREGPLSEARAIEIAQQICQSVDEAHRRGIVHRDIKPENVFLLQTGHTGDFVKVLDFGVAQLSDGEEVAHASKALVYGTPNYMAPEQIRGEIVDARTDVYALGALLYKAVSGSAPFVAETPKAVLEKHLREPLLPMSARAPGLVVSRAFEAVVAKAMSKDPAHRQPNMQALRTELLAALELGSSVPALAPQDQALNQVAVPVEAARAQVSTSDAATRSKTEGERPTPPKRSKKSKAKNKGKKRGRKR